MGVLADQLREPPSLGMASRRASQSATRPELEASTAPMVSQPNCMSVTLMVTSTESVPPLPSSAMTVTE